MDGSEDVQMAEVPSSRSSSLSPPPSSLPDSFEYQDEKDSRKTAPETTVQAEDSKVLDTEIVLDSITLSTPIPEEKDDQDPMAMVTRRKKADEDEAAAQAKAKKQPVKKTGGQKKTPAKKPPPKKPAPASESSDEEAAPPAKNGNRAPAKPKAGKKDTPAKVPNTTPKAISKKKDSPVKVPKTTPNAIGKKEPPKKWLPERALTARTSPLAKLDSSQLRRLLCQPEAWDILNMDEKMEIISLMPQNIPVTRNGGTRPDTAFLASDDNFHADCGLYLRQLGSGQHTKTWITEAMAAHDRHLNGDFDETIKEMFTSEWGVDWPEKQLPEDSDGELLDDIEDEELEEVSISSSEEEEEA